MKKLFFVLGLILSYSIYCFAADGDLRVEIKLKYPQDIANIHISTGLNNSTSFQFQGEFIKSIPIADLVKFIESLKKDYKKLKTNREKQLYKDSLYLEIMNSSIISIFAQNQQINSFIEGKIYFNNEIIAQDSSTLDYGAINLNADLAKYAVELLDK